MALSTSTKIHVFYFYIILFHSVTAPLTTGIYFTMIQGKETEKSVGHQTPLVQKEFFHCGREQSCTHIMKLANSYVIIRGSEELRRRKHEAVCIYEKVKLPAKSCIELYRGGYRKNGQYEILDENSAPFKVFCDFESEANSVWTLIESFSLRNTNVFRVPFYRSHPRQANNPNWIDYRLELQRLKHIHSSSAMWRATCNFPTYKSDIYRDYMRAEFKDSDIMEITSYSDCHSISYINVRGHKGWNLKIPFWQPSQEHIHTDSSKTWCEFDAVQGSAFSEDNFGNYLNFNRAFRCTETDESTTQYWFGASV